MEGQHIIHHYERGPRQVIVKVERNSKGYNWEVTASGDTVDDALAQIRDADRRLQVEYATFGTSGYQWR